MSSTEILRRLKAAGWTVVRTRGSHVQLKHATKPGLVTLPRRKRDLPAGTVRSIEKHAGIRLLR